MRNALQFAPLQRRRFISQAQRRHMGSITWGTRSRAMGSIIDGVVQGPTIFDPLVPLTDVTAQPFQNPDTRPGAWPGLNQPALTAAGGPAPVVVSGSPQLVPMQNTPAPTVVATPTSGPMPSPQAVAAAAAVPASWLDQSLIAGVQNKWLLLGGLAAALFLGGKK